MIPFFSRMFPSTNLQDLNLDWIVRRIMELSKGIIAPWINAQNQHWMVYDTAAETFVDSGVSAAGEGTGPQGEPGKSPVIGSNGNWYTWDPVTQAYTDTGIRAEGPNGPAGPYNKSNILDNWYFLNPVNQRGLTAWQNPGYIIDRWELTSGVASLSASGLTLNGTIVQKIEKPIGLPYVCSALLSDGSMITPTYNDTTKTYTLTATGQTIVAAKLEIGTEQTLAYNTGTESAPVWTLNDVAKYQAQLVDSIGSTADTTDVMSNYNYEKVVSMQQYKPGDIINATVYTAGYFTSSAKSMRFPVYLPKFLPDNLTAQQISITGCSGTVRVPTGGYVENYSSEHDWLTDADYSLSTIFYDATSKVLNIKIDKATAYISGETAIANNSMLFFIGTVQFSIPNI